MQERVKTSMKAKLDWPKEEEADSASDSDSDWVSKSVAGLRKLMSDGLYTCFRTAIKKITENGHTELVAEYMVLRSGPYFGPKDMVSVITDRALSCLKDKSYTNPTFYTFEDLNSLVEYMVLEMVTMLQEIKPNLSLREAMWNLLMCDLNVLQACDSEFDPLKFSFSGTKETEGQSGQSSQDVVEKSSVNDGQTLQDVVEKSSVNESQTSQDVVEKLSVNNGQTEKRVEEKCLSCRERCSGHKKDGSRQKTSYFEKPYKGRMTKKTLKAKLQAFGGLVTDKKHPNTTTTCESQSYSHVNKTKKIPTLPLKQEKETPKPPEPVPEPVSKPPKTADYYLASIPFDESLKTHVPQDEKDKMILSAVSYFESLKSEIRNWDEWANVKVKQVATRLSHDRAELNKLRAEKSEVEKLKKEKQSMEENTTKRLTEMSTALTTANCQIDLASAAVVRLETEKSVIIQEMETAKNKSLNEAKNLEQALIKEQEALKKIQTFGSEKSLLEEDLKALKRESNPLQQNLEKAKSLLAQTETRLAKEEREFTQVIKKAEFMKKERENLESLAKSEDEIATKKAERQLQKCESETKRIQYEISSMKLEQETKKIAEMRTDMNFPLSKGAKRLETVSKNLQNQKKDRECVMCLTEEKTVVLVPCGHQVLCNDCNVIHESIGMKECPSCRTPIEKRITARFAKKS